MHWSMPNIQSNDCASRTGIARENETKSWKQSAKTGIRSFSFLKMTENPTQTKRALTRTIRSLEKLNIILKRDRESIKKMVLLSNTEMEGAVMD